MLLEDCHHFKSISLSEDLKMLEILSLRSSEIESFMVSGNVTTLKLLDLSYTSKLNHISWNIISRFTKLEELYLLDRSTSWGPEKIEPPNKRKGPSLYKGKDGGKKHKEDSASLYQKKEYGLKHGEGSATVYEGKEGGEEFDTSLNEMMEYGSLSEAASSLDRLTSLNICVRERECLSHKISPWENLARFKIFVGVTLLELKIYGIEEEVKLEKNMYIELGRQTVADWVKVLWGKTEFLLLKGTENLSSLAKLDPNPKQEMFSELKILILWKVRAGTSFISSDQLGRLQNLNKLVIKGFRHLKILIVFEKVRISNLAVSSVFPKLRYLKVSDCCALKFLFPVTVIHLFSQLEELYISDCSNMEEVIGVETNDGAILPKLRVLSLENLRKLSKFCQRNIDVYWPFLEKLTVEKCELLEDFLLSIRSVPRLTKVIIDNTCLCLLKNVHLCRIMNRSSGPERICLAGCLKLKDELLGQSYSALRSLTLSNREDTSLMPYNFLRRLSGVERLEVHNCESLEKMIDFQGEEKDSEEQVSSVDPSVASTSANNSEFSEFQPSIVFQNLTVLKVSGCHKLKYLLPERVLRDHMVQLREVSILSCSAMETIIEYDTSEDYDYADKDKEFFLNLRFLNVRFCHNLKYLLPMRMIRGMLKLEVLIILECNAMEMIITHESTEDDGDADKDKEVLPKLKDLYVKSLPQLSSFVGQDILFDWPSLTYICVKDCLGLKKLPLGAGSVPKLGASGWLGPKHWFDELEWNDQEIKSRLLKIRREWD